MRALRVVICVSLSVWKQPPPQALRFSQGRGERLVMNPRDHGKGTRQVWKFESVFLPKMSQFCRLCKLGPGSALGKKAKKKKMGSLRSAISCFHIAAVSPRFLPFLTHY